VPCKTRVAAFVAVSVRVVDPPRFIDVGFAAMVTVGGPGGGGVLTVTVAVAVALPPDPAAVAV
jgi:hypothetical protein